MYNLRSIDTIIPQIPPTGNLRDQFEFRYEVSEAANKWFINKTITRSLNLLLSKDEIAG